MASGGRGHVHAQDVGEERSFLRARQDDSRKQQILAATSEEPIRPSLHGCREREVGQREAEGRDADGRGPEENDKDGDEIVTPLPEQEADGLSHGNSTDIRCEPCGDGAVWEGEGEEGRE